MKASCDKCNEYCEIDEHHLHPKFMDNPKGSGMKVWLCRKCHNILHLTIPKIIFDILTEEQKKEAITKVIKYSKNYAKMK